MGVAGSRRQAAATVRCRLSVFGPEDVSSTVFARSGRAALPLVGGGHAGSNRRVATSRRPCSQRSKAAPSPAAFTDRRAGGEDVQGIAAFGGHWRNRCYAAVACTGGDAAWFLQFLPKPPLTPDQVELLKSDNIVSEAAKREGRTLDGLGITPVAMEAIAPTYLWRFRKTGQFTVKNGAA
jgi:NADH dehydrogenase